jgi:5'-nucleotidase
LPSSARSSRGLRLLAAGVGTSLVATPLVLLTAPAAHAAPVDIQILATNDFHGRISRNPTGAEGGAAVMAGAVQELRTANPNTVFAAAGDLIGASTFESFIANDKPTIDALNEAGLDVSSVGNHEFDKGYDDLVDRVMAPFDETTNPDGGAEWEYLAANVEEPGGADLIPPTWTTSFGAVQVGFVGAVTEHLPELVSPGGIAGLTVTDIVDATNTAADQLVAGGADVVIMLVHEGAPSVDCDTMDDDETSDFGEIVTGVNDNVDAIVSGHTHLAYDCLIGGRPVVSAGQYGAKLNKLNFTVDDATGDVTSVQTEVLDLQARDPEPNPDNLWSPNYEAVEAVQDIVDAAVAEADVLGAQPLGQLAEPFNRAKRSDGSTENRGGESTLGNLVAEVQRWATDTPETGNAQIAFMNPGGLRADMVGTIDDGYPETLTFKQAAVVQPFANTLVNMQLTGNQIRQALEQQWQPAGASRPFLRLGTSEGFKYTYDPNAAAGQRIQQMWLDDDPIQPNETFSVTVNSFLSTGGDNFGAFATGTEKRDTGKVDLQAMVDYMAEFADTMPLEVDPTQHAIGVSAPATTELGRTLRVRLSSLAFSTADDAKDAAVAVQLDGADLGTFPVDNALPDLDDDLAAFDEAGKATLVLPVAARKALLGNHVLTVTGDTTGTTFQVRFRAVKQQAKLTVNRAPKRVVAEKTRARIKVKVRAVGGAANGKVKVRAAGHLYTARLDDNGRATVTLRRFDAPGRKTVRVSYEGTGIIRGASDTLTFRVHRK